MGISERFMGHKKSALLTVRLVVVVALAAASACAQEQQPTDGLNSGNYNIQQSIEAGYRYTNLGGNRDVFNTFVNLNPGFRLFEHTLHLRSLNHHGLLFDDFFLTSFGYGGDPNDVSRLRFSKNKWYGFSASFRRDRNFWNYNLLANPLNRVNTAPFPTLQIGLSPHSFQTTGRMSDVGLTLLPQSRLRVRLGYSRNVSEGPSFSTNHQGTEALVFQSWKTTQNIYRFGFDFKFLPKTNISYDQFLSFFKGDTAWQDQQFPFQLSNGTPVDLGVIFNSTARQPCATPVSNPSTSPPTANAACNGFLGYDRSDGRPRGASPTEQLSFQSSHVKNVDMAGRITYTAADVETLNFGQLSGLAPLAQILVPGELFAGLVTRTNLRDSLTAGPARTRRVNISGDFGITWHVTGKFRVVDSHRYNSFRVPGQWLFARLNLFPQGPPPASIVSPIAVFNSANCPTPFTASTCPQHNLSSPADMSSGTSSLFFGQTVSYNTVELEYDFNKRVGGRLGYRYGHRNIFERDTEAITELFFPTLPNRGDCSDPTQCTAQPDGSLLFSNASEPETDSRRSIINERSLLLGLRSRPTDALRVSFDLELFSADRSFTRISPRQLQHYKVRATYKPRGWISLGAAINIIEKRDNVVTINNLQHNRSYSFTAVFEPNQQFSLDLGYDYNDIFSQTNICFVISPVPTGLAATPCPGALAFLQGLSVYTNTTHFAYGNVLWKPIKRVTALLGYAGSFVNGNTLLLNPNAPVGPLQFNYHKPYAGFAVDLLKGLTWKANWAYYGYNEKAMPILTTGRDFRGNLVTIAFRYAF